MKFKRGKRRMKMENNETSSVMKTKIRRIQGTRVPVLKV